MLITGRPGCGKSTLINRLVAAAHQKGMKVGGISTPEFRLSTGRRGGFLIQNIITGDEEIMASVEFSSSVAVGRYGVNLTAIRDIGVAAIDMAVSEADLVVIDEIGKMELGVPEFLFSVNAALDSSKPVLGTIGLKLSTPEITRIKNRSDVTLILLTPENRNHVYQKIWRLLSE
jgi:nucleoside-triphosphatase THEP1